MRLHFIVADFHTFCLCFNSYQLLYFWTPYLELVANLGN
uniref:Uncharacterized protein n=1 Tax=Arundo donax TaxID=35708 RepID=A0A0A9EGA0_ARUDO